MNYLVWRRILLLGALVALAWPRAGSAWSIRPSRLVMSVAPGNSQVVSITIVNDSAHNQIFNWETLGASADEQGRPYFAPKIDSAEQWISGVTSRITAPPYGEFSLPLTISVPAGVEPGTHYVGVAVWPEDQAGGLSARLIATIKIEAAGLVEESLRVERWEPNTTITTRPNWQFFLKMYNQGSVAAPVKGVITIKNWLDQPIVTSSHYVGNDVLPAIARSVPLTITAPQQRWPGLYRVQIEIIFGRSGARVSAVSTVIYLPWWSWFMPLSIASGAFAGYLVARFLRS